MYISLIILVFAELSVAKTLLPLGNNCTTDAQCFSRKCWPTFWYFGQLVCSPSPAGVPCVSGSTCLSGKSYDSISCKHSLMIVHIEVHAVQSLKFARKTMARAIPNMVPMDLCVILEMTAMEVNIFVCKKPPNSAHVLIF